MSVRCISQVLDASQHTGTDLLMLVVLADYSDDNGSSYPSVAALARKCRMTSRNANYILSALQASGELRVLKNEGPKGTNRYQIVLAKLGAQSLKPASPLKGASPLKPTSSPPEAGFPKPLKPTSDEPSLNRQEPKTTRTRPSASASDVASLLPEVEAQPLKDWMQVRKAKKAGPITETVVKGIRSEAKKAGMSMQAVIEMCCLRGWASFKADWVSKDNAAGMSAGGASANQTFKDCT